MAAHEGDEALPTLLQGPPQLVVAHLLDPRPVLGRRAVPLGHDAAGEEVVDLRGDPRRGVDPVRHRADRDLLGRHVGPQPGEHDPAHRTVERGDPVAPGRQPEPHHRHVEAGLVGLVVAPAEGHELVEGHAALGRERAEVALHQLLGEAVDARRDRRVGREDGARAHGLDGLVEAQTAGHQLPRPLQPEEAGVALVGVEHLRVEAEGLQRPHPTDAEEDLLADAVLGVAAVEPVGDGPALGGVAVHVAVEQVQLDAADVGAPDLRLEGLAGQVDRDADAVAAGQGQRVGVQLGEPLLLHAVDGELLAEVARAVEQPDADEGDAEVARRLQVVTGQHPQAAGVLRQCLRDAELRREVGHQPQRAGPLGLGAGLEPAGGGEVAAEPVLGLLEVAEEARVGGQLVQAGAGDLAEEPDRVVGHGLPRVLVDPAEQVAGGLVPRPPQVHGQPLEGRQLGGQRGAHAEALKRPHRLDRSRRQRGRSRRRQPAVRWCRWPREQVRRRPRASRRTAPRSSRPQRR